MLKLKVVNENKRLFFFDESYNVSVSKIDSLLIVIKGVSTGLTGIFDCIEYSQNRKITNEILHINGKDLGLASDSLPDDIYRCKFILNGHYEHSVSILVYNDLENTLKNKYDIFSKSVDSFIQANEMLNIIDLYSTAIIYNLISTLNMIPDKLTDTEIIDAFDKLKKLK